MLLAILFLSLPAPTAVAAATPTHHATPAAAAEAAAADQSLVLLVFGADWCAPCKQLKRETLSSKEFQEQAGTLHLVEVDVDADEKTARSFEISAVPTLVLMTADGKVVARQTGFQHTAELLPWIAEGRRRAKAGEWEGTAPSAKLNEFISKAAADGLNSSDLQRLIALLGSSDPAERAGAARILQAQREPAVAPLIEAAGDSYLGVRIAASEVLLRLAPDRPAIDPWQSPAERAGTLEAWRKWWSETGKLPPPTPPRVVDPSVENSIKTALADLRSDDSLRRTEAMATLVGHGTVALPAVRDAIKRTERSGDARAVVLLEDVRWAILVPDTIERRAGGVRNALARGKGQERQAAATRLGKLGRDALPALTELVNDTDPLVVESAVRALAGVGGADVIPAMAALLQAADSNLRMTAAQALGHTKNPDAVKPLLTVCDDPNEVVACTALAAVEEVLSKDSLSRNARPVEVVSALKLALADSRWRVRAAAVEVIGKLSVRELTDDTKKLLNDPDGFVVKNALAALTRLNATPDAAQLAALGKRLPALRADTIALMLQSGSDDTIRTVTEIYNSSSISEQIAILNLLIRQESNDNKPDDTWKPLLTRATTASDPRLRRAAAQILTTRSAGLAAELVGPLLADEDRETRIAASTAVIRIVDWGYVNAQHYRGVGLKLSATNASMVTAERLATWHAALTQRPDPAPDLRVAAARFATGNPKAELPGVVEALEKTELKSGARAEGWALSLVLSKLPWPEGRAAVEAICRSSGWFALAAKESGRAPAPVADYLLEPARFKAVLEPAHGDELTSALHILFGYDNQSWSLWSDDARSEAIVPLLATSTNAAWRAAAVYVFGLRDGGLDWPMVERKLAEPNAWVRLAAVQSVARKSKDRAWLEQHVGPLLADRDVRVAETAAVALLEPEIRQAAGFYSELRYFRYENFSGGRMDMETGITTDRPLTTLDHQPVFLAQVRQQLTRTNATESAAFVLLLAQYGDFSGVDRMLEQQPDDIESRGLENAVLSGIALSRDAKYLPALRRRMERSTDDWELRQILQALKGMTGAEARQLRLDINKRMRQTMGSSGGLHFE